MRYTVERVIAFPPAEVWGVLADLRHFARQDPFHRDLRFLGAQTQGLGARFRLTHRYRPVFPFGEDEVVCTVTLFQPERRLTLTETNRLSFKSHAQQFVLEPAGPGATRVRYEIGYRGIPWLLWGLRLWARWLVRRRMAEKIEEIAQDCAFEARARAAA